MNENLGSGATGAQPSSGTTTRGQSPLATTDVPLSHGDCSSRLQDCDCHARVEGLMVRVAEAEKERDEAKAALESKRDFSYRSHRDRAEVAEARVAQLESALERIAATNTGLHQSQPLDRSELKAIARAALDHDGREAARLPSPDSEAVLEARVAVLTAELEREKAKGVSA